MMITNKDYFAAACVYNQEKIPDRFKDQTDYYHLKYTKQSGQVVVASSGWDQAGWEVIPNGSLLMVDRVGQETTVKII